MSLTKHKLKKKVMEHTLDQSERGSGGKKDNPKILPFYDLKFGEKMEVLLVPYEDGDLFKHFKKHGPNMNNGAAGSIQCIHHAHGEKCPACAEGFSHTKDNKATEMSRKWMAKDSYVAQCVVIDSPLDIAPLDDGNEVRIFYMPWAVVETITEAYREGIIEDPTEHILVLKKTSSKGDRPSYANSYFMQAPVSDEVIEAFEDCVIELHDLDEEKIRPKDATVEEVEEWTAKAKELLENGGRGGSSRRASGSDDDQKEDDDPSPRRSLGRKTRQEKEPEPEPEPEESGDDDQQQQEDEPEEKPAAKKTSGMSLRDKLKASRNGG